MTATGSLTSPGYKEKFDTVAAKWLAAGYTSGTVDEFVEAFESLWNVMQDCVVDGRKRVPTNETATAIAAQLTGLGMGYGAVRLVAAAGYVPVGRVDPAARRRHLIAELISVAIEIGAPADEASAASAADMLIASAPRPPAGAAWLALASMLASPGARGARDSIANQHEAAGNPTVAEFLRAPTSQLPDAVFEWWAGATGVPTDDLRAGARNHRLTPYTGDSVAWTAALRGAVARGAIAADDALAVACVAGVAWDAGYRENVAAVIALADIAAGITPAGTRMRRPHPSDNWFRTVITCAL